MIDAIIRLAEVSKVIPPLAVIGFDHDERRETAPDQTAGQGTPPMTSAMPSFPRRLRSGVAGAVAAYSKALSSIVQRAVSGRRRL